MTDIPPSHSYTAGLVTAQMCRALEQDELVAFIIMNKDLNPKPSPDLSQIPISFASKPNERGTKYIGGRNFGELGSFIHETRNRYGLTPDLVEQAVRFGRKHNIDQVWAILQGQTMVRVSRRIARRLGVPLKTQIWDPLSWWHQAWGVDRVNRLLDNYEWAKTLQSSKIVASASPAMSRYITNKYGTPSFPIIAAVDPSSAFRAATNFVSEGTFVIGMAGQFYASDSWLALCTALQSCGWMVAGRKVVLKIMGEASPPNSIPEDNYEYLGWLEQSDVIKVLASDCDICYCPYPFAANMEEVSRLSFPSKIVIYLASGRPILFHGPDYSSPSPYIIDNNVGVCCDSLSPDKIVSAVNEFLDQAAYSKFASSAHIAFMRDFTTDKQRALVREFLGLQSGGTRHIMSEPRRRQAGNKDPDHGSRKLVSDAFDAWYYFSSHKDSLPPGRDALSHYLDHGWKKGLNPTGWFSVGYYNENNEDVVKRGLEPFGHYLEYGWKEGRQPNPWFSPVYYLEKYDDVRSAGVEPFQHYIKFGQYENRDPAPWFSTKYYVGICKDFGRLGLDPFSHYIIHGWREGLSPSPWFSSTWYLTAHAEARELNLEPWLHYVLHGSRNGFDPTGWFSLAYYKNSYPDVVQAGLEPFSHYLTFGWREGRDPSLWFSTQYYLSLAPSLIDEGIEPCSHYHSVGWRQGYNPNHWFCTKYYLANNPDVAAQGIEPYGHYLSEGWISGRDPNDWFSTRFYLAAHPELMQSRREPVTHYLSEGALQGKPTKPIPISHSERCTALAEVILVNCIKIIQSDLTDENRSLPASVGMHFELLNALTNSVHKWLLEVHHRNE
ncbi:glycosyltransferase family protein [Methylorubrum extorquens]